MPLPSARVIHPKALQVGIDASRAAMTDRCAIEAYTPPSDDDWDPATGTYSTPGGWSTVAQPASVVDADGNIPCRIQPVNLDDQRAPVAEQQISQSRHQARLPLDVNAAFDQRLRVVSVDPDHGDPNLAGQTYRVLDHTPRTLATEARVTIRADQEADVE